MSRTHSCSTRIAPAALVGAILCISLVSASLASAPAAAQSCTPTPLVDGVPVASPTDLSNWFSIPTTSTWAVVALAGTGGDWDLYGYDHAAAGSPPDCYGESPARSAYQPPFSDVLAWNFPSGQLPPGDKVAEVRNYEAGGPTSVEYDASPVVLTINAAPHVHEPTPADLTELFAVDLVAGETYTLGFVAGGPGVYESAVAYIFAPSGPAIVTPGIRIGGFVSYLAPVTGRYAIAAAYAGDAGSRRPFSISVTTCPPPLPLPYAGAAVSGAEERYALNAGEPVQGPAPWSALALRAQATHVLTLYQNPAGAPEPWCFSLPLAIDVSTAGSAALLVARDTSQFVREPFALVQRVGGPPGGRLALRQAFQALVPDAPPIQLPFTADDVLEVRSMPVEQGRGYRVELDPMIGPGWSLRVHAGHVEPGSWFALGVADPDTSGPYSEEFVAPFTGDALVVVVNESSATGTASLAVTSSVVDAAAASPATTRVTGLSPNPSFGTARLSFETAHGGEATIRIVDVAGRRVARERLAVAGAGPQVVELSRFVDGRLPSGLYFVSLEFAGRVVGARRLVVLGAGR